MPLSLTTVDVQAARIGPAVPGYPAQVIAAQAYLASMALVYPDDCTAFVMPGRSDLASLMPLQERDAAGSRIWAAMNSVTTRSADSGVLGGLPRFILPYPTTTLNGLYSQLSAQLTDYTVVTLMRANNITGTKWLFGVGQTLAGRVGVYVNAATVAVQHASTDIAATGSIVTANAWLPIIASYRNSDKALSVHCGSTTAAVTRTMTNSPPADLDAAIGAMPIAGVNPHAGEIALTAVWTRPIHTDATALARLVTALNGLAALT